ncbi:MAG: non-canonical purine NTP pyrophosphatase [Candidatus Pacebacteria bacterium]|nr:non-canonical purine NTP pyrophosphatase [Candidatus Paceibacterota bacterium]
MKDIIYITGNQHKADYLAKYLGYPVAHKKVDLDEIQSMDLKEIIRHKVKQAYGIVGSPVVVEDTSLEFKALGGLPGPFIKFFITQMPLEVVCSLLDGKDRSATAKCMIGYFDGKNEVYFEGGMDGKIPEKPAGDGGYGFDKIFIPEGYNMTRAEQNEEDHKIVYLKIKPIMQLKEFLEK